MTEENISYVTHYFLYHGNASEKVKIRLSFIYELIRENFVVREKRHEVRGEETQENGNKSSKIRISRVHVSLAWLVASYKFLFRSSIVTIVSMVFSQSIKRHSSLAREQISLEKSLQIFTFIRKFIET